MPRREPGRLRRRLAQMLTDQGLIIRAEDIHPAEGWWRSSPYADVVRWEARAKAGTVLLSTGGHMKDVVAPYSLPPDMEVMLQCWETITRCARFGIELYNQPNDLPNQISVSSREP